MPIPSFVNTARWLEYIQSDLTRISGRDFRRVPYLKQVWVSICDYCRKSLVVQVVHMFGVWMNLTSKGFSAQMYKPI